MNRLPRVLTAVPQAMAVRLEIAKAINRLAAEIEYDQRLKRQHELAALRRDCELAAEAVREALQELSKAGYRQDQPRWRKGSGRRSGRWSGGAGIAAGRVISARLRGGHHFVPGEIYRKEPLKPETRRVFEDGKTGKLAPGMHGWDEEHKAYNAAVKAMWKRFLEEINTTAEELTPEQAKQFLRRVRNSNNPTIRHFNDRLRP